MSLFDTTPTLPSILAAIPLLKSSRKETFSAMKRLESPPPEKYKLARQLFEAVLAGRELDWAKRQAKGHTNRELGGHALDLLTVCSAFLLQHRGWQVRPAGNSAWTIGSGLDIPIRPNLLLQHEGEAFLTFFHFWQTPYTDMQLKILLRVLRDRLWQLPSYAGVGLKLIAAPIVPVLEKRQLKVIGWESGLATEHESVAFGEELAAEWKEYLNSRGKP